MRIAAKRQTRINEIFILEKNDVRQELPMMTQNVGFIIEITSSDLIRAHFLRYSRAEFVLHAYTITA
jgi:hypothetical protein